MIYKLIKICLNQFMCRYEKITLENDIKKYARKIAIICFKCLQLYNTIDIINYIHLTNTIGWYLQNVQ